MFTPWGYELESLPPIMTVEQYNTITGGEHAGDSRLESALDAASMAVRNLCGWHVAPSLECVATVTPRGRLVQLPARLITAISEVVDGGTELTAGQWEASHTGLIRRCEFKNWTRGFDTVKVTYDAGFDLDACADLKDITLHIVDAALSIPSGVASETAGNVSISYMGNATAVAALAADRMTRGLTPYRLVSAHAV